MVKVAAAGVEAPIIVLSISPPPISKSSITTFPPLLPESKRLEFDSSVEILLSLICIPSTSSWPITVCVPVMPTFPVVVMPIVDAPEVISIPPLPLGLISRFEFETVVFISLSKRFILESTFKFEMFTVPVPPGVKLISAFELELIVLSLKVKLSTVIPSPNATLDVDMFVTVVSPVTPRVVRSKLTALENAVAPDTLRVPSTTKFSFMLIDDESTALIVVPVNPTPSITTSPEPDGIIFKSSLDLVGAILLSLIFILPTMMTPVPLASTTISALLLCVMIFVPKTLMSDSTDGKL